MVHVMSNESTFGARRVLTFDLETADADALFTMRVKTADGWRPVEGPFVRLIGYKINDLPVRITTDADELIEEIKKADVVQGHNIMGFDGLALAWHHGMDWAMFAAKAYDTDPASRQHTPPRSREHGSEDKYDLDHVAKRLGVAGKITGEDGLPALKRQYGGYDRIDVTDARFRAYLVQDVEAAYEVAERLPRTPYVDREHVLLTYAGHMTLTGFLIDLPLLKQRIKEGQDRKAAALKELNEVYGIPLGDYRSPAAQRWWYAQHDGDETAADNDPEKVSARDHNGRAVWEWAKSPLATRKGKDALIAAFQKLGCKHFPRVEKGKRINPDTGAEEKDIAAGREGMDRMISHYVDKLGMTEVKRLCDLVTIVTTIRTIYQTAMDNVAPDGRIHPVVSMKQASGRWSVRPGMTVFGKRGGKWVEREIFVADPGHVVITCDLSQVDMRAVAGHCQDPKYMALFGFNADGTPKDAHTEIGKLLGISRDQAKPMGHGEGYGLGAKRMIKSGLDPALVYAFFDGMARNFPRRSEWRDEIRDAAADGELLDNGFGRKMRCDPRWAYTVAPALMGQGTARDITMEVLIRLFEAHPDYVGYLRNHAHDEFIFVVPEDRAAEIGEHIREAFTWSWRDVPILCDLSPIGPNWGVVSAK
jgi:DNA polymerase-1